MRLIRYLSLLVVALLGAIPTWAQFDPDLPPEPQEPVIKTRLTLVALPADGGTVSGGGDYVKGEQVQVRATANTNFRFTNWTDEDGQTISATANFTFTKGEHHETLIAHFEYAPGTPDEPSEPTLPDKPVYHMVTASASPADGGSVSVDNATVQVGNQTRIRVTTNKGFSFLGMFVADTLYTTSTDFYYTMGDADIHFEARFNFDPGTPSEPDEPDIPEKPKYHTVTASVWPTDGGSVSIENTTVQEGGQTRIRVTTNTNFIYMGAFVADTLYSASTDFYFTMGLSDAHIEARFEYNPSTPSEPTTPSTNKYTFYLSTVRGMPGRTVSYPIYLSSLDSLADMQFNLIFPKGTAPKTDSLRLSAKADGYTVTFEPVSAARSFRADNAEEGVYTMSFTGGQMPACTTRLVTLDLDIGDDFHGGDSARVRINQIHVTNIQGGTETASASSGNVIMREQSEEGTFYYLTIISTGNGQARVNSRTIRNAQYVLDLIEGASANVYFVPDNGYHVERVTLSYEQGGDEIDITAQCSDGRYLVDNITQDIYLTVQYAEGASAAYPLTITASGQGRVHFQDMQVRNDEMVFQMSHGAEASMLMVPDEYYHIGTLTLDGVDATSMLQEQTLTIESMTEAHHVNVVFERSIFPSTPPVITLSNDTITITSAENLNIYYTIDGSNPTTESTLYAKPFKIDHNCTIKAIAAGEGYITSSVTTFEVTGFKVAEVTAIKPTFSVENNVMTIESATPNAVIYYTTDDTDPTIESTRYTEPFTLTHNCIVKAIATAEGYLNSAVATDTIDWFKTDAPVIAFDYGTGMLTLTCATPGSSIFYAIGSTDISTPYEMPIRLNDNSRVLAVATASVSNRSDTTMFIPVPTGVMSEDGMTFTINGTVTTNELTFVKNTIGQNIEHLDMTDAVPEGSALNDEALAGTKIVSFRSPQTVTSMGARLLKDCRRLAAVVWNASVDLPADAFEGANNPNLLLYVNSDELGRNTGVQNRIVNHIADAVVLSDATSAATDGNFYCPEPFTARSISYSHVYRQTTGIGGECRGWETITLPFDVERIQHRVKGEVTPFGSTAVTPHFWLYSLGQYDFEPSTVIEANKAYIISMPKNEAYAAQFVLADDTITFSAVNATLPATELHTSKATHKTFVPNFRVQPAQENIYTMNVGDPYDESHLEGSVFLPARRAVRPFESFTTTEEAGVRFITIFDDRPDAIKDAWMYLAPTGSGKYDLQGRRWNGGNWLIENGKKSFRKKHK